jgi:hypothetical protein
MVMNEETTPPTVALPSWLPEARHRLSNLGLAPEWPEESMEAPSRRASKSADCTLRLLAELGLEPSWMAPSLEGGVCIAFALDGRYADVQFLNNGEIVTTCTQNPGGVSNSPTSESELRSTFQTIRSYLGS